MFAVQPSAMIVWPMLAQFALTLGLYVWLTVARKRAVERGETDYTAFVLGYDEPLHVARITRNLANQFELPVLFYVLIALALPLRHADLFIVLMSWVFVVTRFVHAGIFVTSNDVRTRSLAWFAGVLVLLAMWLYFALKMLLLS